MNVGFQAMETETHANYFAPGRPQDPAGTLSGILERHKVEDLNLRPA